MIKFIWKVLKDNRGFWEVAIPAAVSLGSALLNRNSGGKSGKATFTPAPRDTGQQTIFDMFMTSLLGSGNWGISPATTAMGLASRPPSADVIKNLMASTGMPASDLLKFKSIYGHFPSEDELRAMGFKAPIKQLVNSYQREMGGRNEGRGFGGRDAGRDNGGFGGGQMAGGDATV